jgi:hypothetical protein
MILFFFLYTWEMWGLLILIPGESIVNTYGILLRRWNIVKYNRDNQHKCYSTKCKTLNIWTGRIRIRISLGTEMIKLFHSGTGKYVIFNDLNNHCTWIINYSYWIWFTLSVSVMVFNVNFNSISVILWRSVLLVEETGVSGENHRPAVSNWQT